MLFIQRKMGLDVVNTNDVSRETSQTAQSPEPIFLELDPFTATIPGEYKNRVLYVAITLRLENEASTRIIERYMPEVRDRTLNLLSQQDAQLLQTPDGRDQLVNRLREVLAAPYIPDPKGPEISDVLFTAFVIQ